MEAIWLFPLGVAVASVAMSSGIAGSNFWIPIYLLGIGLEPRVAFWMSLLTMLFGSGSGVARNLRAGTLDLDLVRRYLPGVGVGAVLGAVLSTDLPIRILLAGFGVFATAYGMSLLREGLVARRSAEVTGTSPKLWKGLLAGLAQGILATGSGVLLLPELLAQSRSSRPAKAVGASVALVFVASLAAVLARIDSVLFRALIEHRAEVFAMALFVVPGVVLGGQLGPRLAARLSRRLLRGYVGGVLVLVGGAILLRALGLAS